ncbi:hypothetical protein [uncultured Actinomyces sp.]|uniref:hypothetical protein n=1 Tax=uncultured Actinomyces sp. TaxID=249061 RepID=UPI0028D6BF66|nr:hypothetical protein [uncultured Actinomyces sp.]
MTSWIEPAPLGHPCPAGDGRVKHRRAWAITIIGGALLLIGVCLAAVALVGTIRAHRHNTPVPVDGSTVSRELTTQSVYSFASKDPDLECTAVAPDGKQVPVHREGTKVASDPPQVLWFKTTESGDHQVSCQADLSARLEVSPSDPSTSRFAIMGISGMLIAFGGLLALIPASIVVILAQRRRHRLDLQPVQTALPNQSQAPPAGPPPWPQAAAPGGARPSGSYGIAPRQVIYRPAPAQPARIDHTDRGPHTAPHQ